MIRILHMVTTMDRGGQETLIMNLYRHLDRSKIQFDFLCTSNKMGDYDNEIKELGGRIYHLPPSNIKIPHLYNVGVIRNMTIFFKTHKEYSIVHFHNYHAYSVLVQVIGAKLGSVKQVIVHSHNTNAPHPLIHKLTRPFLKRFKIHRFACSEDAGHWMFGPKSDNFKVIKNGIEPKLFLFDKSERNRLRHELGLEEKKVILHIGRFNYQKNHKFIIEIFEKILLLDPLSHLVLVGKGELEEDIRNLVKIKKLENNVSFMGVRTDIPSLLNASDLFLFPSLFEGLGIVLIETQANGINILTTSNIPKEAIYIDQITQLSLDVSADIWAKKAVDLMKNYERKNRNSEVIKAGYDIKQVTQDLSKFYIGISYV